MVKIQNLMITILAIMILIISLLAVNLSTIYQLPQNYVSVILLTTPILLILVARWASSKFIFHPINELNDTVEKISKGDFKVRINPNLSNKDDELGALARSINRILASLKLAILETGVSKEELKK